MKYIFTSLLFLNSMYATTHTDLGMTLEQFNYLSGLTGLLTAILIVFIVFKAL